MGKLYISKQKYADKTVSFNNVFFHLKFKMEIEHSIKFCKSNIKYLPLPPESGHSS